MANAAAREMDADRLRSWRDWRCEPERDMAGGVAASEDDVVDGRSGEEAECRLGDEGGDVNSGVDG